MMAPLLRFKADDGSEFPEWEEEKSMLLDEVSLRNVRLKFSTDNLDYQFLGDCDCCNKSELNSSRDIRLLVKVCSNIIFFHIMELFMLEVHLRH